MRRAGPDEKRTKSTEGIGRPAQVWATSGGYSGPRSCSPVIYARLPPQAHTDDRRLMCGRVLRGRGLMPVSLDYSE